MATPSQNVFIANGLTHPEPGYYDGGLLTWTSGFNMGLSIEVKSFDPTTNLMVLYLPMPYVITVGDTFKIYPGCDKLLGTCKVKFNNVINFRGEPYIPGIDSILQYPNAK